MRPFTPGIGIVAASSSGACAAAFVAPSARARMSGFMGCLSFFTVECKGPRKTEAQLVHCFIADPRAAHAGIERQAFSRAPDRAEQDRVGAGSFSYALGEGLDHRTHRPVEWS